MGGAAPYHHATEQMYLYTMVRAERSQAVVMEAPHADSRDMCSQAIHGGHTTRDLGQTMSKTQMGESVTKPFTEEVVSYKHGDNIILHQWADTGDLLVNCQSPTPQSFICQVQPRSPA